MIYEKVSLQSGAELTVYSPSPFTEFDDKKPRNAVLVCPGGAYAWVSELEAEPTALELLARDICVFLLNYTCAPARYPTQLVQAADAMAYIKENKERYHLDKIAVMGYSAGGHLAASLGVRWQEPWLAEKLSKPSEQLRPDGMILAYPVISGRADIGYCEGTMENLTGSADPKDWQCQSLELLVSEKTPKTFLWTTFTDQAVPAEHSLLLAQALYKAGVNTEFHMYPRGNHGLSVDNERIFRPEYLQYRIPEVRNWIDMACRWVNEIM